MNFIIYFVLTLVGSCLYGTVFMEMRILSSIMEKKNLGLISDHLYNRMKSAVTGGTTIWILFSIIYTIILYNIYNNNGIKMVVIGLVFGLFEAFRQDPELNVRKLFQIHDNK